MVTCTVIKEQTMPLGAIKSSNNVAIRKLNGLWHLMVGSCQIRTLFLETQSRQLVVAYARRVYPRAKIFRTRLILAVTPHNVHWSGCLLHNLRPAALGQLQPTSHTSGAAMDPQRKS
jgi:hypothetical protein